MERCGTQPEINSLVAAGKIAFPVSLEMSTFEILSVPVYLEDAGRPDSWQERSIQNVVRAFPRRAAPRRAASLAVSNLLRPERLHCIAD